MGFSIYIVYRTNFDPETITNTPTPGPQTPQFLPENRELNENNRIGLGVFTPDQEATNLATILDFEELVDRKLEYVMFFRSWGGEDSDFPNQQIPYLKAYDLTPVITWEPWTRNFQNPTAVQPQFSLVSIVNGFHDDYIEEWALEAKAADIPIVIRFAHEMVAPDGQRLWYPWQGESQNYILAFRRIVTIFRNSNAFNVKFLWNPIAYQGSVPVSPYYPGDDYVDLIGLTVINLGSGVSNSGAILRWKSCREALTEQHAEIARFDKPIIIAELLSAESGGSKAGWYTECFPLIKSIKNIIGVISVQVDQNYAISEVLRDWRVNSSVSSLAAFKAGIHGGDFK